MESFATAPESLRRAERDEVFLRTSLTLGKRSGISAQLVNISAYGFMIRTNETAAVGSPIRVRIPELGELSAQVVWSLGGRIGAEFELPIPERDYPVLLSAIKNARPNWMNT